jgi:hypothetical protein
MILLGALLMLPTIMSGIYALADVTNNGSQPLTDAQYFQMKWHIWLEAGAAALAALIVIIGLGASDHWRGRLHWPMALALLCVLGLMGTGAWFGGESVYRTGTAVLPIQSPETLAGPAHRGLYYYVGDPLQIHMILVGGLLAFTAVGLGLSIRRITLLSAMQDEAALSPIPSGNAGGHFEEAILPDIESLPPEPRIASTRFWLFAFLFAALTAAAGYWYWASGTDGSIGFNHFWNDTMTDEGKLVFDRTAVHVWIAIAILAATLILAAVIHFARPSKLLLTIFAGLLVLLLAAQFWVGLLLAFRGSAANASLFHFTSG